MSEDHTSGQLAALQRGLGRIEGKFDTVIAGMTAHADHNEALELRIRSLETRQAWVAGASSLAGVALGFLGHFVGFFH